MKEGPSIAPVAALAGDPARANMLAALLNGNALTASELAYEAGVTLQTASAHLSKLEKGNLISGVKQGRHRYFRLADDDVAEMLEMMMGVAARAGHLRTKPGPNDPAMRKARVCYDHLAGEMGVALMDSLTKNAWLSERAGELSVTRKGREFFEAQGIDLDVLSEARRTLCKSCLDWSQRRFHLAGSLGAALMESFLTRGWARRDRGGRTVRFTPNGERRFNKLCRAA